MDRRLIDAAKEGDVGKLHTLIRDDPLLLSTVALTQAQTPPLHIACIAGHLQFVKEMLILGRDFVGECDQDGLSPLHIASARGDLEIVKELLKVDSHLCLVKGKERRIPLHSAVAKGRVDVIKELLRACSDSISQVTARGENCLHLAVKNNQFEALEILCQHVVSLEKEDVLNHKDDRGNTILHLAASKKQYEIFDLLLERNSWCKEKLDVNSMNKRGLTPFDILISEGGDHDIEEMLRPQNLLIQIELQSDNSPEQEQRRDGDHAHPRSAYQKLEDYFKYDKIKESPDQVRNILLIVTGLIATATYQAVLSPPGGVWQDDYLFDLAQNNSLPSHTAGNSVMGTQNYVAYGMFLLFNSIGFFMSLHLIYFLTIGLPLQFELQVSLFALTVTYDTCMTAIAPNGWISTFFTVLSILTPFIIYVSAKVVRDYKCCRIRIPASVRGSS